jgi:putative addiction module component (TIGR02574 family)
MLNNNARSCKEDKMSQQLPEAATELLKSPLTVDQRIELIGELWDSIPDSIDALPLPDWHREELERRLIAADADPHAAIPWEQVKERLKNKS